MYRQDVGVQWPVGGRHETGGERQTMVGHVFAGRIVVIDAHDTRELNLVARFFQCLSQGCRKQRLTGLNMSGRLIDHGGVELLIPFFNQQESIVMVDDRSDGQMRRPAHRPIIMVR